MKVLGIDTSTKKLSVAIVEGSQVLAEFEGSGSLRHSQDLIPTIESLLKKTKLTLNDLDGFAISIGPGSFTGLRIGVSTIKALNIVTNKPIAAVPTMDIIAYNIKNNPGDICVIIDAKKNKVYSCIYKHDNEKLVKKTDYLLITPDELLKKISRPTTFIGDGIALYKDKLLTMRFGEEALWVPKASVVAKLGIEKLKNNETVSGDELVPMYLYSRECSIRGVDR